MGIYRSDFSSVTVTGSGSGSGSGGGSGSGSGGGPEVKVAITARGNIDKNDMVQLLPSADAVKVVRSDCAAMRPGNNQMQNVSDKGLLTLITADKRIIGAIPIVNDIGGISGNYYEYAADGRTLNAYSSGVNLLGTPIALNGNGFIFGAGDGAMYFFSQVGASPVEISTQIEASLNGASIGNEFRVVPSTGNSFWLVGSGTVEYWSSSATLVFRENINQTVFYDCATLNDGSLVTGAFIVKQDKSITNYTSLSIGGVYYSGNADHFWAVSQAGSTIYTFSTAGTLINTFSGNPAPDGDVVPYNNDLIYTSRNGTSVDNPSATYTYYLPADKTKSITKLDGTQGYTNIAADLALNILYAGNPAEGITPNLIAFDLTKLTPYSLSNSGVSGVITPISDGALLCGTQISKAIYTQFLGVSLSSVSAGASGYANAANGTYTVNSYYGPQTYNIPPPVNNGPISSGAGAKLLGTSCTVYSSTYTGTSS